MSVEQLADGLKRGVRRVKDRDGGTKLISDQPQVLRHAFRVREHVRSIRKHNAPATLAFPMLRVSSRPFIKVITWTHLLRSKNEIK